MVEVAHVCFVQKGVIYDHWLYLPMVGLALLLSMVVCLVVADERVRLALLGCCVIVLGGMTYQRNQVWQTCRGVWEDVLAHCPNDELPLINLAVDYSRRGDFDKAVFYYTKALTLGNNLSPLRAAQIYANLSAVYGHQGDYSQELFFSQKAIELDPASAQGYGNAGMALGAMGKSSQALWYLQRALEINPSDSNAHNNLGIVYGKTGNLPAATHHFQKALEFNPDNAMARQNLAAVESLQKN